MPLSKVTDKEDWRLVKRLMRGTLIDSKTLTDSVRYAELAKQHPDVFRFQKIIGGEDYYLTLIPCARGQFRDERLSRSRIYRFFHSDL